MPDYSLNPMANDDGFATRRDAGTIQRLERLLNEAAMERDKLRALYEAESAEVQALNVENDKLRAALRAELKFWRNQPSPYRHDERIAAIETALGQS